MTPERIQQIMKMTDAEMLPQLEAMALKYRELGLYEKAKLTDDVIDLLDSSHKTDGERADDVRDIWRRMMEIMLP